MRKFLRVISGVLLLSGAASADMVPELVSVTPSLINPGAWTWVYGVSLSPSERLDTASPWDQFFTIFDFAGFIPGSQSSTNPDFIGGSALVGPNADLVGPPPGDNPAIDNIFWTWTPAVVPSTVVGPIPFPPGLGLFSADSIFNTPVLDFYETQGTKHTPLIPLEDGTQQGNIGSVSVPLIPEPATALLIGSGLLLVACLGRRFT